MTDVRELLKRVAAEEESLRSSLFLAPCVRGGHVRARVYGLLYTFLHSPLDFEGWGIFQPVSEREARLVREAQAEHVEDYLRLFPAMRLLLCYRLKGNAWLAYPASEAEARPRLSSGRVEPVTVHLVLDGREFEQGVARDVGGEWWFEGIDRRASPLEAESLREALRGGIDPSALNLKGLTPEMRACYSLVFRRREMEREKLRLAGQPGFESSGESRLRAALRFGGGDLHDFSDQGDYWVVGWLARDGQYHTSVIAKDLTVISAGICLSGEDQKFDLQSLVGVVEGEW